MPDYTQLAATAKRLIEANGRSVTFRRADAAPANASQPWRGPDAVPTPPDGAVVTAVAAFVPPGSGFGRTRANTPELAQLLTQVCLVAQASLPDGTDLATFQTVVDGSRAWRIETVDTLAPSTTTLIYAVGLSG